MADNNTVEGVLTVIFSLLGGGTAGGVINKMTGTSALKKMIVGLKSEITALKEGRAKDQERIAKLEDFCEDKIDEWERELKDLKYRCSDENFNTRIRTTMQPHVEKMFEKLYDIREDMLERTSNPPTQRRGGR